MSSLYRKAAIDGQRTNPLGRILLIQPVSYRLLSAVALMCAGVVMTFLVLGSYTRHSTVIGQLLPDGGLIKVYCSRPGMVLERHVQENQTVQAGDVLFVVGERPFREASGGLRKRLDLDTIMAPDDGAVLFSKAAELRRQLALVREQIVTQNKRVTLSLNTYEAYAGLVDRDYVSPGHLRQLQEDHLAQQARLQSLERERVALTHALGGQYEVVTATQSGVATAVNAAVGQYIDSHRPLVNIVPENATLHAQLYAPSRAVGFIREGDPVVMRYHAYPHQKFGHSKGTISWISKAAVAPADIAATTLSLGGSEPLYEIRVDLDRQQISAYGQSRKLQTGMLIEADIGLERRRLYEWVLAPLYSMTGRS